MAFTDRLFEKVEPVWKSYLEHPFVKGIGEGTVDEEKFIHYMQQDYVYLIEYSRVFAIGASKAKDLRTMTIFANLLHGTMNYEMDLHREYAAKFGISKEELGTTEPSATMTAYTSYMLSQSQLGDVENAIAAVLACAWSYHYIGKELAMWPGALDHELYGNWVRMYSSDEFAKIAENCKELINDIAQDKSEEELKALEDIVLRTSYFEYMFWDMAENMTTWPVKELVK